MSTATPTANPLGDISDLLREELRGCHHFIRSCFADAASSRNDFETSRPR